MVEAARLAGLDVVALTDHDTVSGWDEAADAARATGIDLVRGIEISCRAEGLTVHLLAYLPGRQGELYTELDKARTSRETRAERIVELLSQDVPITYEQVLAQTAQGTTIGRPHIADALIANGVVADRTEAFDRFLHNGSKYYATHYAIEAVRAVELVRVAGGVPVLAHPFAEKRGRVISTETVNLMVDAGLAGLEADHRDHDASQAQRARDIAADRGLVVTGSSDFHGAGKPNLLGENVTAQAAYETLMSQARSETDVVRGSA